MTDHAPSFLFLQYERALGYAVIASATFAALKARCPDARLAVAASGLTANVFRADPHIDELFVTPHAITQTGAAARFFLGKIWPRRKEFDYVATDLANMRGRVSALALASGVKRRIGLTLRPEFYHRGFALDPSLSNIANNLRILEAAGLDGPTPGPEIHFTRSDAARARALLAELEPSAGPCIAMVTQASKGHPNEWFDDRWVELSQRLIARLGARLVFVGTEGDADAIEQIRARIDAPTLSVAGQTDIPQFAALLALCDLAVTIDTGGLHVARAVNTPAVVIAHSATPKRTWLPLDEPLYRVLLHDYVPCAGCLKFVCATRECMQESTVDLVEAAVLEHLQAFAPSEAARAGRMTARLVGPAV